MRSFRSNKVRALLAYLALHPRPVERSILAALLWPEMAEAKARRNLSQTLRFLRKALGADAEALLVANRRVIGLRQAPGIFVDVRAFEEGLAAGRAEAALEHYRGEFLSGFAVPDSVPFEEWLLTTRARLERQALATLVEWGQRQLEAAEFARAKQLARRQLALDPWSETAYRQLLHAYVGLDDRPGLLSAYGEYRDLLASELGLKPSPAMAELATALNHRLRPQTNLDRPLAPLRGRDALLVQLPPLLAEHTLVTLLGLGGIGKSRLAREIGYRQRHSYRDGVWYVPLAGIPAGSAVPAQVAGAIAHATGYQINNPRDPLREIAAYLEGRQTLLILDNWDHLVEAAPAVLRPLLAGTGTHVLATSRVRLGLAGERVVALSGLERADAATLFAERAGQLVPDFTMAGQEAAFAQIWQQVAGLPLGLELAASWVEHFSLSEIAHSLETLRIAPEQVAQVRPGHHTLEAVFAYSWNLLGSQEQQALVALAVFRGSFDRTAANVVAGATLGVLSGLLRHSLLQRLAAGRYQLHPLIREFAGRRLPLLDPAGQAATRHSRHYLTLLAETAVEQLPQLRTDLDNIRAAWVQAVGSGDEALWAGSLDSFAALMTGVGLADEGIRLLQAALEQVESAGSPPTAAQADLLGRLLYRLGRLTYVQVGKTPTIAINRRLLSLTEDAVLRARAAVELGDALAEHGRWPEADAYFAHAEMVSEEIDDPRTLVYVRRVQIHANMIHFRGNFREDIGCLEEALALLDDVAGATVDRFQLCGTLAMLGIRYRDYALALHYNRHRLADVARLQNRFYEMRAIHDLALAEQFAGMYPEAIAHFEQGLALAKELHLVEDVGLFKANLCLTLRQTGDLAEALAYGRAALVEIQAAGSVRLEGMVRNRLAHCLLAGQRWADAYAACGVALAVWAPLNHPNEYEARAGRARAAFHLGRGEEAEDLAETVLAFVAAEGLVGIVEPVPLLLNCAAVLEGSGQRARAQQALHRAAAWVEMVAGRIGDGEVARRFRERPDNVRLAELQELHS